MPAYDHDAVTAALFAPEPGATLQVTDADRPLDLAGADGEVVGAYWCGRHSGGPALLLLGPGDQAISSQLDLWPRWAEEAGANLLLIDYPGLGSSPGHACLSAARGAALTALRYLAGRPLEEVPSILVIGRGAVGAAVAALAARECASDRVTALVLESVAVDLAGYLEELVPWDELELDRDTLSADLKADFDVVAAVSALGLPTLVFQPAFSGHAPAADAELLAQKCAAEIAYLDGGQRVDLADAKPAEYQRLLQGWIATHGRSADEGL